MLYCFVASLYLEIETFWKNRFTLQLPILLRSILYKWEHLKGKRRRGSKKKGEHSARKSLNLHESQPVITFQCPLAFRSLKYRLISRNDWGAATSACKTRVVHQRYELYMAAGKKVSLMTIMQLEFCDRQNCCVLTRSDSLFSAP